jgi:hypothetical protein
MAKIVTPQVKHNPASGTFHIQHVIGANDISVIVRDPNNDFWEEFTKAIDYGKSFTVISLTDLKPKRPIPAGKFTFIFVAKNNGETSDTVEISMAFSEVEIEKIFGQKQAKVEKVEDVHIDDLHEAAAADANPSPLEVRQKALEDKFAQLESTVTKSMRANEDFLKKSP